MSLNFFTIASSSSGNCTYMGNDDFGILVDCGVSMTRINSALSRINKSLKNIAAIFITHEHSDHICSLAMIEKHYKIPVFANRKTLSCLMQKYPQIPYDRFVCIEAEETAKAKDFEIRPFRTMHDSAESMGYKIMSNGKKAVIVTDLGFVTDNVKEALKNSDIAIIESNHDIKMLLNGPYPHHLKNRILGMRGHLSNEACSELTKLLTYDGCKHIILGHLSKENNTPQIAYDINYNVLKKAQSEAKTNTTLEVAPRDVAGRIYIL